MSEEHPDYQEPFPYKFRVGDLARKVGGSYTAEGIIVACFRTVRKQENRVVFSFLEPEGMLHIFNEKQLELVERIDES